MLTTTRSGNLAFGGYRGVAALEKEREKCRDSEKREVGYLS